jgi:hypothetical protein
MKNNLYQDIVKSFHEWESQDFGAVCNMTAVCQGEDDVAIVTDDPYLLILVFTSLMPNEGMNIHILNPAEGIAEVQRLTHVIQPKYVIVTDPEWYNNFDFREILINGDTISNNQGCASDYVIPECEDGEELDFTVTTYSPYPTKIRSIISGMLEAMVYGIAEDLYRYNLTGYFDSGLTPFLSNNPDYLLYYMALKINPCGSSRILPTGDDIQLVLENRGLYFEHNHSDTLFIPKKDFLTLWEKNISSLFENKFIFRSYIRRKWLVNIVIKNKLKKLFKGFKKVLIIGTIDNSYIVSVLQNLQFVKFYSILPNRSALMYGRVSNSLDTIVLGTNTCRQDIIKEIAYNGPFKGKPICTLNSRLYNPVREGVYALIDPSNRFIEGTPIKASNGDEDKKCLYYLGDIRNSFVRKDGYIFPETLEKVINSYPFIKSCALLTFRNKMILIVTPTQNVLDSNRINQGMFGEIIQNQIDSLNKELPESYKIQGFVVTMKLIEHDRNGEIVRFPFNYCNQRS